MRVLFVCFHAGNTYRHPGGRRSKAGASEGLLGAGLEESEVLALARQAGEALGGVAGAAGHLQPPQRGLRGALTDQKASLGCRLSDVTSQARASVCVQSICTRGARLLAITFEREFPNQRVLRNL